MARLVVLRGEAGAASFEIDQGATLGREKHNTIPLPKARGCSRDHAKVWRTGPGTYSLADLGSTNGTLVNDEKTERTQLRDGDEIQIGDVAFRFELDAEEKPKPKVRATEGKREDVAAMLRGERPAKDRPVATQVEGQAAIEIKQRLLQYHKKKNTGNLTSWDISQTAGVTRLLLTLAAIGIVVAIFWFALKAFG
jgi:pSer/pThr/pTyr-binding forkhead associated (FHA) protein